MVCELCLNKKRGNIKKKREKAMQNVPFSNMGNMGMHEGQGHGQNKKKSLKCAYNIFSQLKILK